MTLGEKIRLLRRQRDWSQDRLARELNVSRQALSRWELDTATPDTANLRKLSLLFGVSADLLLDDEAELPNDVSERQVSAAAGLTERAKRLIDEKGHIGAYLLALQCLPGLLVCLLIVFAYLSVLSGIGPLSEFPPQAFLLPVTALVMAALMLVRLIGYLLLARKLRRPCKE